MDVFFSATTDNTTTSQPIDPMAGFDLIGLIKDASINYVSEYSCEKKK